MIVDHAPVNCGAAKNNLFRTHGKRIGIARQPGILDNHTGGVMEKTFVSLLLVAILSVITLFTSCNKVDSGNVGVLRTFGAVDDTPLAPGIHFIKPWGISSIEELDTRLKSFEVQATASSKDLQLITTLISVQHSLNPAVAPKSYSAVGDLERMDASIVAPAVLESLKAVTALYTAEELVTKRDVVATQISEKIQQFINHTLDERGCAGAMDIANVAIKNFEFSADFNAAIEAKVTAQQKALQAQTEKVKKITEAEAKAAEVELAAEAKAFEIKSVSVETAEAIKREAAAVAQNPNILMLRAIEAWDGTTPKFMGGGFGELVPFVNFSQELEAPIQAEK